LPALVFDAEGKVERRELGVFLFPCFFCGTRRDLFRALVRVGEDGGGLSSCVVQQAASEEVRINHLPRQAFLQILGDRQAWQDGRMRLGHSFLLQDASITEGGHASLVFSIASMMCARPVARALARPSRVG